VTPQEIKVERTSEAQAHKRKNGPSFFKQKKQHFFKKKKRFLQICPQIFLNKLGAWQGDTVCWW
jgi:hypothetical protein